MERIYFFAKAITLQDREKNAELSAWLHTLLIIKESSVSIPKMSQQTQLREMLHFNARVKLIIRDQMYHTVKSHIVCRHCTSSVFLCLERDEM